jgi:hypothetical protein
LTASNPDAIYLREFIAEHFSTQKAAQTVGLAGAPIRPFGLKRASEAAVITEEPTVLDHQYSFLE